MVGDLARSARSATFGVRSLPPGLDMAAAAPLMCAGTTMFSALRQWRVGPGERVAIAGMGGLGHGGSASPPTGQLISGRRRLAGTSIGSFQETRAMLEFCAANNITAETEIITADQMDTAFKRLDAADVWYRLVLDAATL